MATYLSSKTRAFKSPSDRCNLPLDAKSLFHLKTYPSATDPRAWAQDPVEQKQYIMEMVAAEPAPADDLSIGKYVNIQALLKTLLTNKDEDIMFLQSQLSLLDAFVSKLKLNPEQKSTLTYLRNRKPKCDVPSVLSRKSTSEWSLYCENLQPTANHNVLFDGLNRKLQEQEIECERNRALAHEAVQKLESMQSVVEERNRLVRENDELQRSMEWMRNTKSSSNNDLTLKTQISQLRFELERKQVRLDQLDLYRAPQVSIPPAEPVVAECGDTMMMTDPLDFIELKLLQQERDALLGTVASMRQEIQELKARPVPAPVPPPPPPPASCAIPPLPPPASKQRREEVQFNKELRCELEFLRARVKDYDIKCLECDRLRLRVSELCLLEKEFDEFRSRCNASMSEHKQALAQAKSKTDSFKEQAASLQEEVDRLKHFAEENAELREQCATLQKLVEKQQAVITHLEEVVANESARKIDALKEQLDHKDGIIKVSEEKLAHLQKQIRETISALSCESTILKNGLREAHVRIAGLLEQENELENEIKQLRDEVRVKDELLLKYEESQQPSDSEHGIILPKVIQEKDNLIEQLRHKLFELQRENEKLTVISSRIQMYMLRRCASKNVGDAKSSKTTLRAGRKHIDNIHNAMEQLQRDLSQAKISCDDPNFYLLQGRYKEIQLLAKNQVQWLASELRKCKARVQCLEIHIKSNNSKP